MVAAKWERWNSNMALLEVPPISGWKRWIPARPTLAAWVVLAGVLTFSYWPAIVRLLHAWKDTPDYEHGFLVPLFAAFLLWVRQDMVNPWPRKGVWWAMAFFVVWAVMRWSCKALHYERDMDSLFPFLMGLALFLGGWKALQWSWSAIVFLVFMVPLPGFVADSLSHPLQKIATRMSVYVMQTIGIPAIIQGSDGNVIQLSDPVNRLEVAQACSGIRMLTLFVAVCVGAAFLLRLKPWEKITIVVSAIPIAIIANVTRITLTGMLTEWINAATGTFIHDRAAFYMMPLALLLLWGEMTLISKLLIDTSTQGPLLGGPLPVLAVGTASNVRKLPSQRSETGPLT